MSTDYKAMYDEAINTIVSEKEYSQKLYALNEDLIALNKKVSASNSSLMFENQRMKEVSKHGAFVEYGDSSSMKFIPVLGNINELKVNPNKPTKLMFTFKFSDFEEWAMTLHNLMAGKENQIEFINKEDLE